MRTSSGGWVIISAPMPDFRPPAMPNAAIWLGRVLWPWFWARRCNAAIIFSRPARLAPPASARNSRWRLNQAVMKDANRPNIRSSTNTTMK